jgi:hypothetical protein
MRAARRNSSIRIAGARPPCLSHLDLAHHPVLQAMRLIHDHKAALCTELEDIADRLPSKVSALACLSVAERLLPALRHAHAYEESVVFPLYDRAFLAYGQPVSVDRLCAEHVSDAFFAADITAQLLELGHAGRTGAPETLGFMLRGFFDSLRRHTAFEIEHVAAVIGVSRVHRPI